MTVIDINIDAGESYGAWRMGDDAGTFPYATSVNLACGFHGGDPASMFAAARLAMEHGLAIGAHPGLPDLVGFGRRAARSVTPDQAYNDVVYQIGALSGVLGVLGGDAAPRQAARRVLDARRGGSGRRRRRAARRARHRSGAAADRHGGLAARALGCRDRPPERGRGLPGARLRAQRAARTARHPGRRDHRRGRGGAPRGAHGGRGQGGRDRRHARLVRCAHALHPRRQPARGAHRRRRAGALWRPPGSSWRRSEACAGSASTSGSASASTSPSTSSSSASDGACSRICTRA